jgi:hypothetical protein
MIEVQNDLFVAPNEHAACEAAAYDVYFGTESDDELPICRLEDSFAPENLYSEQQQLWPQHHATGEVQDCMLPVTVC